MEGGTEAANANMNFKWEHEKQTAAQISKTPDNFHTLRCQLAVSNRQNFTPYIQQ
jgi:hypothetical protein